MLFLGIGLVYLIFLVAVVRLLQRLRSCDNVMNDLMEEVARGKSPGAILERRGITVRTEMN